MTTTTATYTVDQVRKNVTTLWDWAERAILALYEKQTEAEKRMEHTNELNHRGFSAFDAEILTSFAKQIIKHTEEDRKAGKKPHRHLSTAQLKIAFARLGKYSKQLHDIAAEKAAAAPRHDVKLEGLAPTIEESSEDFNREWARMKNEFACLEARQEREAFASKMVTKYGG